MDRFKWGALHKSTKYIVLGIPLQALNIRNVLQLASLNANKINEAINKGDYTWIRENELISNDYNALLSKVLNNPYTNKNECWLICEAEIERTPERANLLKIISFSLEAVTGDQQQYPVLQAEQRERAEKVKTKERVHLADEVGEKEPYSHKPSSSVGSRAYTEKDKAEGKPKQPSHMPKAYYFLAANYHTLAEDYHLNSNIKGKLFSSAEEAESYHQERGYATRFTDGYFIFKIIVDEKTDKENKIALEKQLHEESCKLNLMKLDATYLFYKRLSLSAAPSDFIRIKNDIIPPAQQIKSTHEKGKSNFRGNESLFNKPELTFASNFTDFLNIRQGILDKEQEDFINRMQSFITPKFFKQSEKMQFDFIYQLRYDSEFMDLMRSNWQMSCLFLDKIIKNYPDAQDDIMRSRYNGLYKLNNARKEMITDLETRRATPMIIQQALVLRARDRVNSSEGMMTQALGRLELEGQIEFPEELICPISMALLNDPVSVTEYENKTGKSHRFVFEKSSIIEALKTKNENPFTRQPLNKKDLEPAEDIKEKVIAYKKKMASGEMKQVIANTIRSIEAELKSQNKPKQKR